MKTTGQHIHTFEAEDRDECLTCGEIVCPDCGEIVDYHDDGEYEYTHRTAGPCYLHRGPSTVEILRAMA